MKQIRLPKFVGRIIEKLVTSGSLKAADTVQHHATLGITGRSLLYFKAEACIGCDDIDVFIGQLCAQNGVALKVIDANKRDLPKEVYGDGLFLDEDGQIRKHYKVRMFPTLISCDAQGKIEQVMIGGGSQQEVASKLGLTHS